MSGWTPTAENVNALPEPVRQYVAELATRADPAADVRRALVAEETVRQLEAKLDEAARRPHGRQDSWWWTDHWIWR